MRLHKMLLLILLAGAGATGTIAKSADPPTVGLESVYVMQVDGWIVIDPQGRVADYQRDTKVPDDLSEPINRAVRSWLFKPVVIDGAPVQAKAKMRITLAAQKTGEVYHVVVDNVIFPSGGKEAKGESATDASPYKVKTMGNVDFPIGVLRAGIAANVEVAFQIGQDGKVANACIVQSALPKMMGKPRLLTAAVEQFEKSALASVKTWTFTVDRTLLVGSDHTDTETGTISYTVGRGDKPIKPGTWSFETRTAKRDIPWLSSEKNTQHAGVSDSNTGEMIPIASIIQLASSPIGQAL